MKRRVLSLIIAAAIMSCVFVQPAFAATDTSASVDLNFEIRPSDVAQPDDSGDSGGYVDPLAGTYLVNIPSAVSLNYEDEIVFVCSNLHIEDDERLVVSIDGSRTFPDGSLYLTTGDGADETKRAICNIVRGSSSDFSKPPDELLTGPDDAVVATFKNGYNGADTYGWLKLHPAYHQTNIPGIYTGTVYFKIAIVGE
jgi:hypothetical protein